MCIHAPDHVGSLREGAVVVGLLGLLADLTPAARLAEARLTAIRLDLLSPHA